MKTRVTHIVSDAYVFFLKGYSLELEHSAHFFKMVISIRVLWSPGLKKKISDKMWQVWAIIEDEERQAVVRLDAQLLFFLKFPKIGSNWRFFFNERHLHTPTGKKSCFYVCVDYSSTMCVVSWRAAEIASELSIKVIFPKSGWQVWLNTLVYDDSLQSSVQKHKI